jgi:VanZ family protein
MTLQRFWWVLGVFIVIAAILVCVMPGRELPAAFEWNDKLSHVAGHGLMAVYFAGLVPRHRWWKVFVFLLLLGIAIEIAQYFMPFGRDGDARDVVANASGAALGLLLARLGLGRWPEFAEWLLGRRAAL